MTAFISACRYSLLNVMLCCYLAALLYGGDMIWIVYFAALIVGSGFDEGIGDGQEDRSNFSSAFYNFNLYAAVPLLAAITVVFLNHLTPADPIGLKYALSLVGIDFHPLITHGTSGMLIAATAGNGYFSALAGMTIGHELCHRASRFASVSCRILLSFTLNTSFAIAHVHGHHRNVATYPDPGSARRNEYVLVFAFRSTILQHIEAFKIEAARLARKGLPTLSWHNKAIRDQLYPLALVIFSGYIAGYRGVMCIIIAGVFGSILQKLVDYSQHYGLVRADGRPVEERHSWDCHRFLSNALQFNLPLHAHHHRAARTPFWELRATDGAPCLPVGYQAASYIALVPPVWRRIVNPKLAYWDEHMANDEERELIRQRGWEIAPGSWYLWPLRGAAASAAKNVGTVAGE